MPERFHVQLGGDDASLLKLGTDDTVLLSSEIGHNSIRYAVLTTIRRPDVDRWCEVLATAGRPYRFERASDTGDSEEVRISGSPDWLS
ncbi:hypothetical protein AWB81_06983 [Caballeronia arationis]|uniref:hypothetical protein n=1 Tax=Caballeronia arationis TaxID=1777142 RepID=UPI00074C99BF|nr:hypothetical protein [Caballeronia arationis]SAL05015.1 hypothetical protein AWB81_06983 [Caballeronia arationis]